MNHSKTVLLCLLCFCVVNTMSAQRFLPQSTMFSHKKVSYITLENGKQVKGNIKNLDRKKGLIEEIKIKTSEGKTVKIAPEDIKHMYLPQSGLDKMVNAKDFLNDAQKWDNADVDRDVMGQGYAYFEKSEVMVKKKKRTLLMMLINPSFSSKIKVYLDPYAGETASAGIGGITLAGGDAKSYYVKKGNAVAYRLYKKDYKVEFKALFEDCPSLVKMNESGAKWSELETHLYTYTVECN